MEQTWVQSQAQVLSLHIAISFGVAISMYERPGNLWEALTFVLLRVHFLRHFVQLILPQFCELVQGFTICLTEFNYNQVRTT